MSKPPAINDRDARRAQALRSNLRRRKASPELVRDLDAPASDVAQTDVEASSDTNARP